MKRKILRISPLPAAKLALVFWFISGAFNTTLQFFEPTQGPKPPTWLFVTLPFLLHVGAGSKLQSPMRPNYAMQRSALVVTLFAGLPSFSMGGIWINPS
jgi:hypothetical protein